jgi:hypothetical protein
MNANWVPVFYGSVAEVLVLQEALEANGIPALAPDVEHLDIATLGGSAYTLRLLVPQDRLELARSLVPESKRSGIPAAAAEHASADADSPAPQVEASPTVALPRSAGGPPEELGGEA